MREMLPVKQIMKNIYNDILFKIITKAFSLLFIKESFLSEKAEKFPVCPEDFVPVIRFGVCSDIHIKAEGEDKGAQRLESFLQNMYTFAENDACYKGFDALVVAGDFTNRGKDEQYQKFLSIIERNKREETKLLICMGNHEFIEYRDYDASKGTDVFDKYIKTGADSHNIINGYHFVGVSYDSDGKSFKGKKAWLDSQLSKAQSNSNNKPVFVFQHPHPLATVYGSICWGSKAVRDVLKKHRNVIDFSGHSHYPPNDPRSLYQGGFTGLGTGSLEGLLGNTGYIKTDSKPECESAGCLLVEGDKNGNIKIISYDSVSEQVFSENQRYIENPAIKKKFAYTWKNQKRFDTKPEFISDKVFFTQGENGNALLSFSAARGFYPAESYDVVIRDNKGKIVFEKTVISDYVRADSDSLRINIGNIPRGKYSVKIKPRSPFARFGHCLYKETDYFSV